MRLARSLAVVAGALRVAVGQNRHVPACLADCLRNVTNPCDQSSLGELFTCLTNQCTGPSSGITLVLAPKAEYSCQQSFVPGSEDTSSPLTVVGDASCVTNGFNFRSFIPSTGPASDMNFIAQKCTLEVFPDEDCLGDATELDLSAFRNGACAFYGGRSVTMNCGELRDPVMNPYRYLEHMCANSTTVNATTSVASYGSSPSANSTVRLPSIGSYTTTTASVVGTPYSSASAYEKASQSSGSVANEPVMQPSVVALVAVVAAAIFML